MRGRLTVRRSGGAAQEDAHSEGGGTPPDGGTPSADHGKSTSEVGTCTDFAPRAKKMAMDRRQKPPTRLDAPNLRQVHPPSENSSGSGCLSHILLSEEGVCADSKVEGRVRCKTVP